MQAHEIMAAARGVVRIAEYGSLRNSWSRLVKNGELLRVLPGVLMDPALSEDHWAWMRAVHLWNPNAVIAGRAAACVAFGSRAELGTVPVYAPTRLADRGPLRFRNRTINDQLLDWHNGLRVTGPEATALTAGLEGDFEPGTTALRRGLITPASITEAVSRWSTRPPDDVRRVLKDLSGNPWSVAEVEAHRLFREAGITGWVGNPELVIDGLKTFPDIALLRSKIAFEVNSYAHHSSRSEMEHDAGRMNRLLSVGWRVYVLTPMQFRDLPVETAQFVRSVVWERHRKGIGGPGR